MVQPKEVNSAIGLQASPIRVGLVLVLNLETSPAPRILETSPAPKVNG